MRAALMDTGRRQLCPLFFSKAVRSLLRNIIIIISAGIQCRCRCRCPRPRPRPRPRPWRRRRDRRRDRGRLLFNYRLTPRAPADRRAAPGWRRRAGPTKGARLSSFAQRERLGARARHDLGSAHLDWRSGRRAEPASARPPSRPARAAAAPTGRAPLQPLGPSADTTMILGTLK